MYTHRGAYLNALGEVHRDRHELRDASTSGRCRCSTATAGASPGRVTAVGGTHVCLRKVEPGRIWELIDARGRHPLQRRADRADRRRQPPEGARGSTRPVTVHGRRARRPRRRSSPSCKELNFRPVHVYGLTETYGPHTVCEWHPEWDALPAEEQARLGRAPGRRATSIADLVRVVDDEMRDVPRDGETLGEVVMRGNNVMKGYYERARGDRRGLPRRLVPLRRPGGDAPRRLHRAARPQEGHHHLRRREHLHHRGRAGGRPAPGRAGVRGGRRSPTRSGASGPKAFVTLKPGADGHRGGDHRVLPRAHRALQVPGRGRVRRPARRPRPARSRSSCCASGSGPAARSGSTECKLSVLDQSPIKSGKHAGRGGAGDARPGAGRGAARLSPLLGRRASLELGPGRREPRGADRPDRRAHVAPQGRLGRGHAEPLQLAQGRGVLPDARDALSRAHRSRYRTRAGERPAHGPGAAARAAASGSTGSREQIADLVGYLGDCLPANHPFAPRAGHARGPDGAGGVAARLERPERALRGALRPRLLVRPLHQRRRGGRGHPRVSRPLPAVGGLPRAAGERGRVRPVRGHRGRGAAPRARAATCSSCASTRAGWGHTRPSRRRRPIPTTPTSRRSCAASGGGRWWARPEQVRERLGALAAEYAADELVVVTHHP